MFDEQEYYKQDWAYNFYRVFDLQADIIDDQFEDGISNIQCKELNIVQQVFKNVGDVV